MRMRRPGSAERPLLRVNRSSSLSPREADFYFHCAFRFSDSQWLAHMLDSLVRVSRRVLKVPKAIASQIGQRSVRELRRQQSSEVRTGTRSDRQHIWRACDEPNAQRAALNLSYTVERVSRDTRVRTWRQAVHSGSTASRRPTPNGSRRPTRRKVHAFAIGSKNGRRGKRERFPSHDRFTPTAKREWISPFDLSGFSGLPLNGFTYSWTLSSKCFSTFPHGTCSLSVSWSYLALDGVYHPLRAALSSNPTLRRDPPAISSGHYGPGTLYGLWPRSRRTWTRRMISGYWTLPNTTFPGARYRPRDSVLGSSLFARSYWGNPS